MKITKLTDSDKASLLQTGSTIIHTCDAEKGKVKPSYFKAGKIYPIEGTDKFTHVWCTHENPTRIETWFPVTITESGEKPAGYMYSRRTILKAHHVEITVSTVGALLDPEGNIATIGRKIYYETLVYNNKYNNIVDGHIKEAAILELLPPAEVDKRHEDIVQEIKEHLQIGYTFHVSQ